MMAVIFHLFPNVDSLYRKNLKNKWAAKFALQPIFVDQR